MRSPAGHHLSEASAKGYALLRSWEDLAPLDSEQLAAVDLVARHVLAPRLPSHLLATPSVDDAPAQPETSVGEVEGAVLNSGQAFYQWHAKLEALRVSEAEQEYEQYVSALTSQIKTCQEASQLIDETLTALNESLVLYKDAVGRSRSLRDTGERLVQEQEQLSAFAEAIRDRLHHFDALESIAAEFHSVASSLDSADLQSQSSSVFERFLAILQRLDECISYVTTNPQYSESASYELRFRQLHGRTLGGILHRVREVLKSAAKNLNSVQSTALEASTEAEETNKYYVKFRALVEEQLQSVFAELSERSARPEYKKLFEDCQQSFVKTRISLILDLVRKRVSELRGGPVDILVRDGFSYIIEVCRAEHQLFLHFFPDKHETIASLSHLMDTIGTVLYDDLRPRLITVHYLDDLCDYVSILKNEIIEGQLEDTDESMETLKSVVLRTLADAQERLIFRAQAFIQEKIDRYEPTAEEMSSLPSSWQTIHDSEEANESSQAARETCYTPLRLTLDILEKLYEALEPGVFGGIAHNAIIVCSLSINRAIGIMTKALSVIDGQLFAIRHLLILREELIRFRMEFLLTEKDLDFTHMRDHMRRVLSGEVSVFQLPASSMAQLMTWTAPRVTDTQVDSKKRLEKQLKEACEALIMMITKAIIEPMLAFLTKVSALRGGQRSAEGRPLSDHAFASPQRLGEIVSTVNGMLESQLPELVGKMRAYLPQHGTFSTLYKPIKANIIDAHAQIASIIEQDYKDVDTRGIQLKMKDELADVMDNM